MGKMHLRVKASLQWMNQHSHGQCFWNMHISADAVWCWIRSMVLPFLVDPMETTWLWLVKRKEAGQCCPGSMPDLCALLFMNKLGAAPCTSPLPMHIALFCREKSLRWGSWHSLVWDCSFYNTLEQYYQYRWLGDYSNCPRTHILTCG